MKKALKINICVPPFSSFVGNGHVQYSGAELLGNCNQYYCLYSLADDFESPDITKCSRSDSLYIIN